MEYTDHRATCLYCGVEIMLVRDQSILNGQVVRSDETWRTVQHGLFNQRDRVIAGTGQCSSEDSPLLEHGMRLHRGIPDLTDPDALEAWLRPTEPPASQ